MIRQFIASGLVLLALALPAAADTREVYTIPNLEVDQSSDSVIAAREAAMSTARTRGAQILINKITLAEDRANAGGIPISPDLAERLSAAVDVQEETAGAGRYKGVLTVVYNPRMVRAHLESLKVPYVDTQAPLSLMVPLASSYEMTEAWRQVLGDGNINALAPYVTSNSPGYTAFSDWSALSAEATSQRARRGILADLQGRDGAWRVQLSVVTAAGSESLGATPPQPSLLDAAVAASRLLDESWKHASIVRGGVRSQASASVRYTSLAEWNTLRTALARSPLVSDFKTIAVSRDGALVSFAYAGDPSRLQNDLLQRGVSLLQDFDGWELRSAVSAAGGQ